MTDDKKKDDWDRKKVSDKELEDKELEDVAGGFSGFGRPAMGDVHKAKKRTDSGSVDPICTAPPADND